MDLYARLSQVQAVVASLRHPNVVDPTTPSISTTLSTSSVSPTSETTETTRTTRRKITQVHTSADANMDEATIVTRQKRQITEEAPTTDIPQSESEDLSERMFFAWTRKTHSICGIYYMLIVAQFPSPMNLVLHRRMLQENFEYDQSNTSHRQSKTEVWNALMNLHEEVDEENMWT